MKQDVVRRRRWLTNYLHIAGEAGSYPALDGLRAIAILLVLARHATDTCRLNFPQGGTPGGRWLGTLLLNGWSGVDLFFALSGFLVGSQLLRHGPRIDRFFIGTYFQKRVLRTFPLYWFMLLACSAELIPRYLGHHLDALQFLVHLFFLQDYMGSPLLLPVWSLAVEEKFYLLSPFLVLLLLRLQPRQALWLLGLYGLAALVLAECLLVASPPGSYGEFFWMVRTPFQFSVVAILFGVGVALIRLKGLAAALLERRGRLLFTLAAAAIALLSVVSDWFTPYTYAGLRHWQATTLVTATLALLYALLVLCCVFDRRLGQGWLGAALPRLFARLSYALYLAHYTMIPLSLDLARQVDTRFGIPAAYAGYPYLACFLLLSFVAAVIIHLLVEKPFLLWRDWLSRREALMLAE